MILLDPGHRCGDLAQGIGGQAGREQHRALVDEQVGFEDAQPVVQCLGMVEVGQRRGEVTTGMRGQAAFLARGSILQLLAALGVQGFGPGVVQVGSLDMAQGQVHRRSPVQGPRLPDQVTRSGQQADGGLDVLQGLGVAAENVEGADPADQDPAREDTATALQQVVQDRQAAPGLAGQHQRHGQARRDVGFPVQLPGAAREPARRLELCDRLIDIAEVFEDHAGRLVRDRGLCGGRMPGEDLTGGDEGFRWPR